MKNHSGLVPKEGGNFPATLESYARSVISLLPSAGWYPESRALFKKTLNDFYEGIDTPGGKISLSVDQAASSLKALNTALWGDHFLGIATNGELSRETVSKKLGYVTPSDMPNEVYLEHLAQSGVLDINGKINPQDMGETLCLDWFLENKTGGSDGSDS